MQQHQEEYKEVQRDNNGKNDNGDDDDDSDIMGVNRVDNRLLFWIHYHNLDVEVFISIYKIIARFFYVRTVFILFLLYIK